MTSWEGFRSIGINHLQVLKNLLVEALAEIFDFVAGLVQSVPKKTSVAKSDLLNTTARLWNLEGSATGINWTLYFLTATPEFSGSFTKDKWKQIASATIQL